MFDLSVFNRFALQRRPVGMKYLLNKQDAVKELDKKFSFHPESNAVGPVWCENQLQWSRSVLNSS